MDQSGEITVGNILIQRGAISRDQLNMAIKLRETAQKSGEALVKLGAMSQNDLEAALEMLLA